MQFQFQINIVFQTVVIEEYSLYTLDNFIAESGGNLGLLLGESLFSLFESFMEKLSSIKIGSS